MYSVEAPPVNKKLLAYELRQEVAGGYRGRERGFWGRVRPGRFAPNSEEGSHVNPRKGDQPCCRT